MYVLHLPYYQYTVLTSNHFITKRDNILRVKVDIIVCIRYDATNTHPSTYVTSTHTWQGHYTSTLFSGLYNNFSHDLQANMQSFCIYTCVVLLLKVVNII